MWHIQPRSRDIVPHNGLFTFVIVLIKMPRLFVLTSRHLIALGKVSLESGGFKQDTNTIAIVMPGSDIIQCTAGHE